DAIVTKPATPVNRPSLAWAGPIPGDRTYVRFRPEGALALSTPVPGRFPPAPWPIRLPPRGGKRRFEHGSIEQAHADRSGLQGREGEGRRPEGGRHPDRARVRRRLGDEAGQQDGHGRRD